MLRSVETITSSLVPVVDAELARKLTKDMGTNLDTAVVNLRKGPKSERQGPLHIAATSSLKTCKMLLEDYQCDVNLEDADGTGTLFLL